ncbi:ATP-binding cassette domain-containing protein [Domibacillus indicus]|uniref:ATP-binding cassette domain-containing protein n=1 Tax=Domibacillus indicus TaxID=1437523 RepID=UPI000617EE25|nr:ABC transporter ATP-binding protein [Domibacillus indicus]
MTALSVENVTIKAGSRPIIHNLSFHLNKGEWLALVGQSGSGKSMTASAVGRILPPNVTAEGRILYEGQNLLELRPAAMRKLRGKKISFVFQEYKQVFNPFMTIGRHFDEYQRTHESKSKKERILQAKEALVSVSLPESFYSRYPSELSGGQLQRAAIALALLLKPDLLIADEPTTALDSVTAFSMLELLSNLQKKVNCSILFVTHDLRHVRRYADRVAIMHEGTIIEAGSKEQIFKQPFHPYTKQLLAAVPTLRNAAEIEPRSVVNR